MDDEGIGATIADVDELIDRDFPAERYAEVWEVLSGVEAEVPDHSIRRVQVAALLLAGGDLEQLMRQVETANTDYRDVLAPAFYRDQL